MMRYSEMQCCEYLVLSSSDKILFQSERLNDRIASHSCAKPFQMMPVCLLGLHRRYRLTSEEITLLCSSSMGQRDQTALLQGLLVKTGIDAHELELPPSAPMGRISYQKWHASGAEKSVLYHQCLGNHIAMFMVQRELTGSGSGYLSLGSAVQQMILEVVLSMCQCDISCVEVSRDGCGAPCYTLPYAALARGYLSLCSGGRDIPSDQREAITILRSSISRHPLLLEGSDTLSSILSCDNIIAKTGSGCSIAIGLDTVPCGLVIHSPTHSWSDVARTIGHLLRLLNYQRACLYERLCID